MHDVDMKVDELNPRLQLATQLVQCPGFPRPVELAQRRARRPPWSLTAQQVPIVFDYCGEPAQDPSHVSSQLPNIITWKGC